MDREAPRGSIHAALPSSVGSGDGGRGGGGGRGGVISGSSRAGTGSEGVSPPGSVANSIHSAHNSHHHISHTDHRSPSGSPPTSISEGSVSKYVTDEQLEYVPDQPEVIQNNCILGDVIRPPLYTPLIEKSPDLSSNRHSPNIGAHHEDAAYDKDEDRKIPKSYENSEKRAQTGGEKPVREEEYEPDEGFRRMYKFTLYETTTRYYIVGSDLLDSRFRILKIDRTADVGDLSITEDEVEYTREEMSRLLATIEDGNIVNGGLKHRCPFWGLLGFIRFTGAYYMLLITKRSTVAMIGGHYVYQIDSTELVPLTTTPTNSKKSEHTPEEARFVHILGNLDLSRSFYFSYSYDITHTLQHNIAREREALGKGLPHPMNADHNDMFAWNHYLLQPAMLHIKNTFDWCLPIIHGYVDQATISVYGRVVYITIIARRSRHFAGARFLKRGANDLGYVANDVETEQIVSEMLTTSFHAPGRKLYCNPNYTSYVQHRGSIPLFWTQENNAATPKPPIELNLIDPFFSAAALHFDNMFQRYGSPLIVLNLIKNRERVARESILLKEFTQAITYLNQFLPKESRIHYIAWDMSRASKSRDQDVIETLEDIAEQVLKTTGFFHNGSNPEKPATMQNGVCRTNCIDCLDRTNAAQFVVGKRALGHQLHALGVISDTSIDYDTDAVNLFTHMYHDHGDTIAVQYAGSHLVNTMETYRKINQWTSHSRDMLESFKRYYNNSFLDAQRQEAINLFLGNYIFARGQPMLWDLTTDYYLHHMDPRQGKRRRSYIKWWTPFNLQKRMLPDANQPSGEYVGRSYSFFDDYWTEYYRPKSVSTIEKLFSYNLNSTIRYIGPKLMQEGRYNLSPFKVRTTYAETLNGDSSRSKRKKRKSVKIALQIEEGADEQDEDDESVYNEKRGSRGEDMIPPQKSESQLAKRLSLQNFSWVGGAAPVPAPPSEAMRLEDQADAVPRSDSGSNLHPGKITLPQSSSPTKSFSIASSTTTPGTQGSKTPYSYQNHQMLPLEDLVSRLLNPSVSSADTDEYSRYMSHPLNLPLVTTNSTNTSTSRSDSSSNSTTATSTTIIGGNTVPTSTARTAPTPTPIQPPLHPAHYGDLVSYVNIPTLGVSHLSVKDEDVRLYERFVSIPHEKNVLGVEGEEEGEGLGGWSGNGMWRKRWKAYQSWLTTGRLKGVGGGGGGGGGGSGRDGKDGIATGLGGNGAGPGGAGGGYGGAEKDGVPVLRGFGFTFPEGVAGGLRQAMGTDMLKG